MNKILPNNLVDILRSEQLRIRTGVILIPDEFLNSEGDIAVNLGIGHQNICTKILAQTPSTKKFLGVNRNFILENIDDIVKTDSIPGRCVLISGVDLLLAAITNEEIMHFWSFLRDNFRRERGVLISIPNNAGNLLPLDQFNKWNDIERITFWEGSQSVL